VTTSVSTCSMDAPAYPRVLTTMITFCTTPFLPVGLVFNRVYSRVIAWSEKMHNSSVSENRSYPSKIRSVLHVSHLQGLAQTLET
jgi:hypothetical protein